ncbi:MAG: type pantothenate kinase [Burkholderiales bacterium]|jgi:type III pantothenate kinase|nr:type pantothenate kinase [Burkholderiales bacterium]
MLLCLDVGNTQLCGGVFNKDILLLQFRYDTKKICTSDELGVFIRSVLRENGIDYNKISKIGIASVVPSIDYTIRATCIKYLNHSPLFLQPGIKVGMQIKTVLPNEVGADLIAGAIAAKHIAPNENLLVFDFGTATTCCYINSKGEFLGASIAPGIRLMMESLHSNTAKLFGVDIVKPATAIGKNTKTAIQSGIYYSQLGLVQQLIDNAIIENEMIQKPVIFATGGFSSLFMETKIFNHIIPELVLIGIKLMLDNN